MNIEHQLLNEYKKYDYLNADKNNPLVKIFVSYIKPSFLFKSEILTPIHLGRAVEKESSKDGKISNEDIAWLHQNCIGDDDFEGNISNVNRRVGFLTGTYWAWKNYEKLGNPKYFGSFGYRRLLNPDCLDDIQDYDMILPIKRDFSNTIKEQFIEAHSNKYYNIMLDTINNIYPNEISNIVNYFNRKSGYYAEIYILKKDLFFDFCEWIFPIVTSLLNKYNDFIEMGVIKDVPNKNIEVVSKFLEINKEAYKKEFSNTKPKEKEQRDIAFILERITGYYLYNLTCQSNIKIKESPICDSVGYKNFQKFKSLVLAKMREHIRNN
jgi:hypothetical protein